MVTFLIHQNSKKFTNLLKVRDFFKYVTYTLWKNSDQSIDETYFLLLRILQSSREAMTKIHKSTIKLLSAQKGNPKQESSINKTNIYQAQVYEGTVYGE